MTRLLIAVGNDDLQLDDHENYERMANKKVSKSFANSIYNLVTSVKETAFDSTCSCYK